MVGLKSHFQKQEVRIHPHQFNIYNSTLTTLKLSLPINKIVYDILKPIKGCSMFQNSIIKEFSKNLDNKLIATRWVSYQEYLKKIDFIKTVKEEKYQDGFLKDIFEECLGYRLDTTNPSSYNLEREKKNETDSKKADGAIIIDGKIIGIIELKAQDTKNLDRVQAQAFYYLSQHQDAKYVIISNFDELRLYIEKSTAYERFSLFDLDFEEFKKFHLLLSYESIQKNIPRKIKEKSNSFEQNISKELYKDYSTFRLELFENIVKNNHKDKNIDKSILLRLTQKLCDRIIFMLFAEDRGLLRANTIREIREEFANQKFTDYDLYDIYKFYFDAISLGNDKLDIPRYNGGMFLKDELLDSLKIDDDILDTKVQKLSDYDFLSEVSVNILGHIFEQSLTDLEELQANLDDTSYDKTKSKRKKDGVFYTPEYITRYIVENTLGKMCTDKRAELNIASDDLTSPKNPKKLTKSEEQTKENLLLYKEWLLSLKILDPACGSGAFLNQALEFLIAEHNQLQYDLALMGDLFASYMVEEEILEHNLYGVDINEDAVEIAKLSLWLRTAKRGRALTKLADKIKCGNSLIDDKSIVSNAFVWEEEFSEVFENGGFDIVIGNPPYVGEKGNKDIFRPIKEIWKDRYEKNSDLLYFFFMKSIDILKNNGNFGFITTNYFLTADSALKLRKELKTKTSIYNIINFNEMKLFESALGQHNIITIFKKTTKILDANIINVISSENISSSELFINSDKVEVFNIKSNELYDGNKNYIRVSRQNNSLESVFNKIIDSSKIIEDICFINTGFDSSADRVTNSNLSQAYENIPDDIKLKDGIFILTEDEYNKIKPEKELIYKCYKSSDIERYLSQNWQNLYVIWTNKDTNIDNYPNIKKHLERFRNILEYKTTGHGETLPWFSHHRAREYDVFANTDKIVLPYRSKSNIFSYSNDNYFGSKDILYLRQKDDSFNMKYLLALLNSKLYYIWLYYKGKRKGETLELYVTPISEIPIKNISKELQQPFIALVDEILESKQKIKDYKILLDEAIANNNFDREIALKKELENLENICISNENRIGQMVYKLYDLTDDEIKIVEKN